MPFPGSRTRTLSRSPDHNSLSTLYLKIQLRLTVDPRSEWLRLWKERVDDDCYACHSSLTVRRRWIGCRWHQPVSSTRCQRCARATGPSLCRTLSGTSPCPSARRLGLPSRQFLRPQHTNDSLSNMQSCRDLKWYKQFAYVLINVSRASFATDSVTAEKKTGPYIDFIVKLSQSDNFLVRTVVRMWPTAHFCWLTSYSS